MLLQLYAENLKSSDCQCYVNLENLIFGFLCPPLFLKNWYSLHARLNSHYEAWSCKKRKRKKVKAYRKSI